MIEEGEFWEWATIYGHRYGTSRKKLQEMRKAGELAEERQEILEPEVVAGIKAELKELLDVLTPPASASES